MKWFVEQDGTTQQQFILSLLHDKFQMSRQAKSDDSIGLLSFKEGDRSYLIENVTDREAMNHLRNIC